MWKRVNSRVTPRYLTNSMQIKWPVQLVEDKPKQNKAKKRIHSLRNICEDTCEVHTCVSFYSRGLKHYLSM